MNKDTETALAIESQRPIVSEASPEALLAMAVQNGADIGVVERLAALAERFQESRAEREFEVAMTAFQDEVPPIVKTKQGYGYKYEDLARDIIDPIRPIMRKHGLSHRWDTPNTDAKEGEVAITCVIAHSGGHKSYTTLSGPYDKSGSKNAIQSIGSVVTYLQRYTLKLALGLAASKDDDGQQEATSKSAPPPVADKAPPAPPTNNDSDYAWGPDGKIMQACRRLAAVYPKQAWTAEALYAKAESDLNDPNQKLSADMILQRIQRAAAAFEKGAAK